MPDNICFYSSFPYLSSCLSIIACLVFARCAILTSTAGRSDEKIRRRADKQHPQHRSSHIPYLTQIKWILVLLIGATLLLILHVIFPQLWPNVLKYSWKALQWWLIIIHNLPFRWLQIIREQINAADAAAPEAIVR